MLEGADLEEAGDPGLDDNIDCIQRTTGRPAGESSDVTQCVSHPSPSPWAAEAPGGKPDSGRLRRGIRPARVCKLLQKGKGNEKKGYVTA